MARLAGDAAGVLVQAAVGVGRRLVAVGAGRLGAAFRRAQIDAATWDLVILGLVAILAEQICAIR